MKIASDTPLSEIVAFLETAKMETEVTLLTSGTTGEPKEITRALGPVRGRPQPGAIWALTYQPWRWAGLSILWRCARTGEGVSIPRSSDFAAIAESIAEATHVPITPSMFRTLDLLGLLGRSDGVRAVVFGGEAALQRDLDRAREIFPSATISHVYATTEHGDLVAVKDGWEGIPLPLFSERCTGTGDLWHERGSRMIFAGRRDGAINVGGAMVHPETVERAALAAGASAARAYPIPSALLGHVVGLEFVGHQSEEEMRDLLSDIPRAAQPVEIRSVHAIDLTGAGKIRRGT